MAQPLPEQKGSPKAGCCGGVFFILFALPFLGFFLWHAWQDLRTYTAYRPATCTILSKQLLESSGEDGSTYKPEVEFEFVTEDGRTVRTRGYDTWDVHSSGHDGQQALLDRYEIGKTYTCWYDPQVPTRAVITRRISWLYLITLLPLLFIVIGVCVVRNARRDVGRGESPEARLFQTRMARAGKKAATQPSFGCLIFSILVAAAGAVVFWQWPVTLWGLALALGVVGLVGIVLCVISLASGNRMVRIESGQTQTQTGADRNLTAFVRGDAEPLKTEPGEVLAVALTPENPHAPGTGCLVFSCVLVAASAVIFWQWAGSLWGLALALGVAGLIGAIVSFFSIGSRKRIRKTQVEVNTAELLAGQELEFIVRLTGQTELNGVTVRLVCEERATYQQGTDTTTEKREVFNELLAEHPAMHLTTLEPLELRGRTRIPVSAMHSFKAKHNEVVWFVELSCDIPRWPDSKTRYPVIVAPRWGNPDTGTKETES